VGKRAYSILGMWTRPLLKNYAHKRGKTRNIHNIEETTTIDDVVRTVSNIYDTMEDQTSISPIKHGCSLR